MHHQNNSFLLKSVRGFLLYFIFLSSMQSHANESEELQMSQYAVDAIFRCNHEDYLFPIAVFCGDREKIYESADVGIIIKSVIVDGKPIIPKEVILNDLSIAKIKSTSRFFSYEVNLNGLAFYDNNPDKEIGELKAFLYNIPEKPNSVEIIYYSRETLKNPIFCRAVFSFVK